MKLFNIIPVSKPRMTRSDVWKKRKVVVKYREYKDELKLQGVGYELPEEFTVTFGMELPDQYSRKKKELLLGQPHKQRPDIDNLLKGLMDALLTEDCRVWKVTAKKIWAKRGFILIEDENDNAKTI